MMDSRILHFFGGKGGAGKTTLASAFALHGSERLPDEKILLISLDSARTLGDVLRRKLTEKPSKIAGKGSGGLFAAEAGRSSTLEPFLAKNKAALDQAA